MVEKPNSLQQRLAFLQQQLQQAKRTNEVLQSAQFRPNLPYSFPIIPQMPSYIPPDPRLSIPPPPLLPHLLPPQVLLAFQQNLPPQQMYSLLLHHAQLLEQQCQRARASQYSNQVDSLKHEQQRLISELSAMRQSFQSQIEYLNAENRRIREKLMQGDPNTAFLQQQLQESQMKVWQYTEQLENANARLAKLQEENYMQRSPREEIRVPRRSENGAGFSPVQQYVDFGGQQGVSRERERGVPQSRSPVPPKDDKVRLNIQQKLQDLLSEKQRLQADYQRSNPQRKKNLELELEILETNISRLQSKLNLR